MSFLKTRVLILVILVVVVGLLVRANIRGMVKTTATAQVAPMVQVTAVGSSTFVSRVVAPAAVAAADEAELRTPFAAGAIIAKVKVGDRVAKDQVLFELDTEQVRSDIRKQETTVINARASLGEARLQAEVAPSNYRLRQEETQRQFTQAETALADARKAAVQNDADLRDKIAAARLSLARLRAAPVVPGPVELAAARQAVASAQADLAIDPLDAARQEAVAKAQNAHRDLERKSLEQAEANLAKLRSAEAELTKLEDQLAGLAAASEIKIATAAAAVEKARFDISKVQLEINTGTAQAQLQAAEQTLANAEKTLAELQDKVSQALVKAPFGGVMLDVKALDAQTFNAGVTLGTVGVLDRVRLNIRVDEADIGKLAVGLPLVLRTQAFPGEQFPGRVTDVSVQAGATSGQSNMGATFLVRGEVENPGQRLRVGQNGDVEITAQTKEGSIVLGAEAIRSEGGQRYVYVLEGNTARRRQVEIGNRSRSDVEIVSGLTAGERVITGPFATVRALKDGQQVRAPAATGAQGGVRGGTTPGKTGGTAPTPGGAGQTAPPVGGTRR